MNDKERIAEIVKEVADLLGFTVEPTFREVVRDEDGSADLTCVITVENDSQFLIGHHGGNLYALEHITHMIARQQDLSARFRIDVNDYRKEKDQMFARIAEEAAAQAYADKKAIVLRPMNPYERRLVHTALAGSEYVSTESIGEGREKKVVVSPKTIV